MDKKDIYEYLAKIYLDSSSATKKKKPVLFHRYKNLLLISVPLVLILALSPVFRRYFSAKKGPESEVALLLLSEAAKMNFNFDPAKKETYSINLNKLNLVRFKVLAFALKKTNYSDNISVRVELTNAFKEKAEVYLKDIPNRWQEYKIPLSEFRGISDWSEMTDLSFILEEWNTRQKHGIVYIDNIKLLRRI